jgi:uncharacterized phage-associated protein
MEESTIVDVALLFLHLESTVPHTLERNIYSKVHKLCYYAQGYYLALTGYALFQESFICNHNGPFCIALENQLKDRAQPLPPVEMSKFSTNAIIIIHYLYLKFTDITVKDLELMSMSEDPYIYTKLLDTISITYIQQYFSNRTMRIQKLLEEENIAMFFRQLTQKFNDILHAKEVAYQLRCLLTDWKLFDLLTLLEGVFSKRYQVLRWPGQTYAQSVFSSIVFPAQALNNDTTTYIGEYFKPHIQYKIVYAAKFSDKLAICHLHRMLELFLHEEQSDIEETPSIKNSDTKLLCEKLLSELNIDSWSNPPLYETGQLWELLGKRKLALDYLNRGATLYPPDPRCIIKRADYDSQHDYTEELEKLNDPNAYIVLGRFALRKKSDKSIAFKYFMKCGTPEGLFNAGRLVAHGYKPDEPQKDLILEAANKGLHTAMFFLADKSAKHGNYQDVVYWYGKMAETHGDLSSYVDQGRVYEYKLNDLKQAEESYVKAGIYGKEQLARLRNEDYEPVDIALHLRHIYEEDI